MHLPRILAATLLGIAALVTRPVVAAPLMDLGIASNYNVFILGDMSHQYADVEGRLAVGGNLTLEHYALGMLLDAGADHTDTLVVGGTLSFSNGRVYHGNVVHGDGADVQQVGLYAGENPAEAAGILRQGNPIDFNAAAIELEQRSRTLGSQTSNGALIRPEHGGFTQLLGGHSLLNVFDVSMADLTAGRLDLIVPDGAWTLINVSGKSGSLNSMGIHFGDNGARIDDRMRHDGSLSGRVLFNFFEAESLDVHALALPGSLLAPFADLSFYNARIDGQVIAKSLHGAPQGGETCLSDYTKCSGQSNWYPFIAMSAQRNEVPSPGSLILVLTGALLLIPLASRRRG